MIVVGIIIYREKSTTRYKGIVIKGVELNRTFLQGFISLYSGQTDILKKEARASLVSTVASCLSVCSPEDRELMMDAIFVIGSKISDTRFEDGLDFITFMKDEIPQIKKDI